MNIPGRSFCLKGIAVALFLAVFAGCAPSVKPFASTQLKTREGARMAILPLDNLSKTPNTGRSLDNVILIEFLKRSPLTIVDPGEVAAALSEVRIRLATAISKENVQILGKKLGVDYFLVGIVHDYDMQTLSGAGGSGQVPAISITLRLIDANTGDIVWATNYTRRGNDRESVFGIGRVQSLTSLAEETAAELAQAFATSFR